MQLFLSNRRLTVFWLTLLLFVAYTVCTCNVSWRAQELNSVEAIKGAVQHDLGVAFVSVTAIQKELELGLASRVSINGVRLFRTLSLVSNPRRDYSRMARKFMVDVFGMVNLDSVNAQRQNKGDKDATAALPHVNPAARPWENGSVTSLNKPILQQVQNLGSSQTCSHPYPSQ